MNLAVQAWWASKKRYADVRFGLMTKSEAWERKQVQKHLSIVRK